MGVAGNKLVSRIAAGYLERPGVCDVLRGSEENFIGPLPVAVLPGVGAARERPAGGAQPAAGRGAAPLSVAQLRLAFGPFGPAAPPAGPGDRPLAGQPPRRAPRWPRWLPPPGGERRRPAARRAVPAGRECGLRLRVPGRGAAELRLTVQLRRRRPGARAPLFARPQNRDLVLLGAAEVLFRRACRRRVRVKGLRSSHRLAQGAASSGSSPPSASPRRERAAGGPRPLRERYGMEVVQRGRSLVGRERERSRSESNSARMTGQAQREARIRLIKFGLARALARSFQPKPSDLTRVQQLFGLLWATPLGSPAGTGFLSMTYVPLHVHSSFSPQWGVRSVDDSAPRQAWASAAWR